MAPIPEVRSFIFQNICEQLSPAEVRALVFTQNLPPSYLGKSALEVFMKLEMLDKYSVSDLLSLSKILKLIHRKDLAKKVEEYNKKHSSKKNSDVLRKHADFMYMIEANLKVTKLQTRILLEQIEELKQSLVNGGCGFVRVTEVVTDAVDMIEDRFQKKLAFVSSLLAQRLDSVECRTSVSPSTSVSSVSSSEDMQPNTEDVRCPTVALQRDHEATKMHTTKAPQSTRSPLLPPGQLHQQPEALYEEVHPCASPSTSLSTLHSAVDCTLQMNNRIEVREIVTGRDNLIRAKPRRPPTKPKPKNISKVQNRVDSDYSGGSCSGGIHADYSGGSCSESMRADYSGGSGSTSTGDSGFVEVKRYLKEPLMPKMPTASPGYIPLNAKGRDKVEYYKSRSDIVFNVMEDLAVTTERVYENIPLNKRS